jgi:hypothetical protein
MDVNLNSGPRRLLCAAVSVLAVGMYIAAVSRHYIASRLDSNEDPKSLVRAAELEPGNAEPRWKLGRYSLFVAQDPSTAVSNLEIAVALNAHLARYWLDLAAGYQLTSDTQRQRTALDRALEAEPTAPDVAWEAANFYLVQNDLERALPLFRVVMANDPKQTSSALKLCWHATQNVNTMLTKAVPAEPAAYFAFLNLLTVTGETAPAEAVWRGLTSLGGQFTLSDAYPFFDYLLQKHETETAVQVWEELVKRNTNLQSNSRTGNLIFDGGLEKDFLNGGFDWRYSVKDPVQLSVDTSEFHGGNRALRMIFHGPAVSDAGIFEYVPVHPNTDYHFSVYTKAEDIESASGPRVTVLDAYSGESYVLTDDSLGTTGWREQSADFRTRPETSLLVVTARRVPGNVLIKGKFWIDDVSLVKR